jgi:predicted RNase H-like nuclease (RuvC/YqgF family)
MSQVLQPEDREHKLIEAVVSMAKSFREERDRLARRLTQLEREIDALAFKLDQRQREFPEIVMPVVLPPGPSRTRL